MVEEAGRSVAGIVEITLPTELMSVTGRDAATKSLAGATGIGVAVASDPR